MDDCLYAFLTEGRISKEAALHAATDKARFEGGGI